MFRCLAFFLACPLLLFAQEQVRTEIELHATAKRTALAVAASDAVNLNPEQVRREFTETLRRNLERIAAIAVLREGLPSSQGPDSYQLWAKAGCDWLMTTKVTQATGTNVVAEAVVIDVKSSTRVTTITENGTSSNYRRLANMVSDAFEDFLTGTPGVANSRIIFCRDEGQGVKEIYQADRDGSNIIKLTNHKTLTMSPTLSRDGKLAYLTYSPRPTIWGQKAAGGPFVRIFPPNDDYAFNVYTPVWNPDGKRMAFVQTDGKGNTDIMLLDVESGRLRRLTGLNDINSEMCWNPAGNRLAFVSGRDGTPQIYLMDDDGTNVRKLDFGGPYNSSPAWSPDGSMIAFVSRFEDDIDLFLYKFGDPNPYQITTGFANSENPAWSPDSRQIIFSSTREGGSRLYFTDLSGNQIERAMSRGGCQQPIWVRGR
jgi:TolB protein